MIDCNEMLIMKESSFSLEFYSGKIIVNFEGRRKDIFRQMQSKALIPHIFEGSHLRTQLQKESKQARGDVGFWKQYLQLGQAGREM